MASVKILAILNITPDSFSDGGRFAGLDEVVRAAGVALDAGADILDVGGESTRPGAVPVPAEEEIARVVPAIRAIRAAYPRALISIDTRKAAVAEAAVQAGACMINDVSGLQYDPSLALVAARYETGLVLMHSQGTPDVMQRNPGYPHGVVPEVKAFLGRQAEAAMAAGVPSGKIILDPGFGFGKTVDHNLALLHYIDELCTLGFPVLAGTSRKSFLTLGQGDPPPDRREALTAASLAIAVQRGAAYVRLHDVPTQAPVVRLLERLARVAQNPVPR